MLGALLLRLISIGGAVVFMGLMAVAIATVRTDDMTMQGVGGQQNSELNL
jgi:hypothetical protein